MPSDVELSLLTASGLLEPNAAWTETGRRNVDEAVQAILAGKAITVVPYRNGGSNGPDEVAEEHLQLVKLHGAIGRSILLHKYVQGMELPTMEKHFDWTLGRGSQSLRDEFGVDHAIFVYARDSFTSGGRTALIFAAALFGVGVPGGQQAAFISLVNLETGDVAWFNVLVSGTGDLRQSTQARDTVNRLLAGAPL